MECVPKKVTSKIFQIFQEKKEGRTILKNHRPRTLSKKNFNMDVFPVNLRNSKTELLMEILSTVWFPILSNLEQEQNGKLVRHILKFWNILNFQGCLT